MERKLQWEQHKEAINILKLILVYRCMRSLSCVPDESKLIALLVVFLKISIKVKLLDYFCVNVVNMQI